MNVETRAKPCASPFCRYPAFFDITEDGVEEDEWCSPACALLMKFAVVAAHMETSDEAEFLSQQVFAAAEFLNARGDNPREPMDLESAWLSTLT